MENKTHSQQDRLRLISTSRIVMRNAILVPILMFGASSLLATDVSVTDYSSIMLKNESFEAQSYLVSGIVEDSKGEPLIGVNVVVKGTTLGTMTGIDGDFTLNIPDDQAELQVSYLGYQTTIIRVNGKQKLTIVLKEATQHIEEVVVTAMGIERKSESLTYATQKIGGKELTRAKDVNFVNALQGKTAGMTITPNASGAGGGASKIVLRGQSSILGNNQPLIVLDGIPLSNGMGEQAGDLAIGGSRDGGDVLSTINPDDIADISILKGPNAAALYGSAANNGVLLITTRSGREGKVRLDVSSNTTFETPLIYPKGQHIYAPEIFGNTILLNGWGKQISELTADDMAIFPYLTQSPRDNVKDFYTTGQTYNNSVSLSGGSELANSYFSYANTTQSGLIENNKFYRHNLLLKESFQLFDKRLKLDFSVNYITQKTKNRPTVGKAFSPIVGLYRTPSAIDLRYFDRNRSHKATSYDNVVTAGTGNSKLIGQPVQTWDWNEIWINNPYYMLEGLSDELKRNRFMATVNAKVVITNELDFQARASVDKINDENIATRKASMITGITVPEQFATYWKSMNNRREIFSDYLLTYNKEFEDITLSTTVGTSFKRINHQIVTIQKSTDSTYVHPNIAWPITGANGSGEENTNYRGGNLDANDSGHLTDWETALFATAQVGFFGKAYLDVSFRNDWSKAFQQFAKDNKYQSYPYWSVGGNMLLREIFPQVFPFADAMKLRASYSVVGNSIPNSFYNSQFCHPITGNIIARAASFDDPKPETTKAFEVGLDGILLGQKLDFDITFYQSVMENQYLRISTASGQSKPVNSGKVRNRGFEFSAGYNHRFTRDLRWRTALNFAYNDNTILETYRPTDGSSFKITVGPNSLGIRSEYIEGGSYGDLYVKDFVYDDKGKIVLTDGRPSLTSEYTKFVGNATSKFTFGWNNTFTYKDFSLYFLIDGKIGGKVISLTQAEMDEFGLSKRSASAREKNKGMVTLPDGQQITARNYYETIGAEQLDCVYDATNVRLREISLGYTWYDLFGPSKNLMVSLIARNLGFIYKNAPVDPDISVSAENGYNGIETFSLPTTRSFGINLKMTF